MSCKKHEESIYLYDELTQDERTFLNHHLKGCAACAALFQRMHELQSVVKDVADRKATVRDASLLTHKIMSALPKEKATVSPVVVLMNSLFTRYAFGAVSLVLIFFFVNEQQRTIPLPGNAITQTKDKAGIALDTNAFMKALTQEQPAANSLYLCVKGNQCDFEWVKIYKQRKQKRNDENI